jgi:hypothetical protein
LTCWYSPVVVAAAAAIATGAAQYDLTPGYGWPSTIMEDYSSKGRTPIFFDAQGNRFPKAMVYLKPDVIGPHGLVSNKATRLHSLQTWCAV